MITLKTLAIIGAYSAALVALYVLNTMWRSYRALKAMRKKVTFAIYENWSPFGGHISTCLHNPKIWKVIEDSMPTRGPTCGWMFDDELCVVTRDLDLIKTMVFDEPMAHINRRLLRIPMKDAGEHSIFFAKDEKWKRIRKAAAPSFSPMKVKTPNVQAEIHRVIDNLLDSLERKMVTAEQKGNNCFVIDIEDAFQRYALDLVFTCFYKQTNRINHDSERDYWRDVNISVLDLWEGGWLTICGIFPIINPIVEWFVINFLHVGTLKLKLLDFITQQTRLNMKARKQIEEAKRKDKSAIINEDNLTLNDGTEFRRNMMDNFIDRFHDGKISEDEYMATSYNIFAAGYKTTADALAKLVYFISIHRDVQDKLRESIIREGQDSEYLVWVINETLRLFPPVPIGCSRTISRDIPSMVGVIPANTFVITPVFTIHRYKEYWGEDANEFKPERWSGTKSFHPAQYIPFGAGVRGCPGKDFALQEMKVLLNIMMRRFKFEFESVDYDPLTFNSPLMIFTTYKGATNIKISRISQY